MSDMDAVKRGRFSLPVVFVLVYSAIVGFFLICSAAVTVFYLFTPDFSTEIAGAWNRPLDNANNNMEQNSGTLMWFFYFGLSMLLQLISFIPPIALFVILAISNFIIGCMFLIECWLVFSRTKLNDNEFPFLICYASLALYNVFLILLFLILSTYISDNIISIISCVLMIVFLCSPFFKKSLNKWYGTEPEAAETATAIIDRKGQDVASTSRSALYETSTPANKSLGHGIKTKRASSDGSFLGTQDKKARKIIAIIMVVVTLLCALPFGVLLGSEYSDRYTLIGGFFFAWLTSCGGVWLDGGIPYWITKGIAWVFDLYK